jgi:hypothetical protein
MTATIRLPGRVQGIDAFFGHRAFGCRRLPLAGEMAALISVPSGDSPKLPLTDALRTGTARGGFVKAVSCPEVAA